MPNDFTLNNPFQSNTNLPLPRYNNIIDTKTGFSPADAENQALSTTGSGLFNSAQIPNNFTLNYPLYMPTKPLLSNPPLPRYNNTIDTKTGFSLADAEGQAPSQSHSAAALDNASARTLLPAKSPKLKPRPSRSTFRDAEATQPKSNTPADANAKAGEAGTYARYEIAKADESSAESRVNAIDEVARAGEISKDSEFDGARRENTSPSLKNVKPSEEYGQDTPKDDFPKDDSPKDNFPKDDFPKEDFLKDDSPTNNFPKDDSPKDDSPKNDSPRDNSPKDDALKDDFPKDDSPKDDSPKIDAPDQIKDGMLKSSSSQPESQKLPARQSLGVSRP